MPRTTRVALLLLAAGACASPPQPSPGPSPTHGPAPQAAGEPSPVAAPAPAAAPTEVAPPNPALAAKPDTSVEHRRRTATVRLALVGDINLGTATLPGGVPPDSGRALLAAARPALGGDLVIGNFEGVLADSGDTGKCGKKKKTVVWRGFTKADSAALRAARARADSAQLAARSAGRVAAAPDSAGRVHAGTERRRTVRLSKPTPSPHGKPPRSALQAKKRAPAACYAFLTPTFLAPRLAEAGFTHLNLANNHANDFGLDGRASTETTLASQGLGTYGPLGRVIVDTVRRGDAMTTVGVLGFTTYPFAYDLLDIPASVAAVDSVRRLVDVLIVTFHGGAEGAAAVNVPEVAESLGREPRGDLRAWAHAVIDAGADAIVGHGPHVLRGVEFWKGKPIAYSLGNFATYRGFNLAGPQAVTGVLTLELAGDGRLLEARLVPMRQAPLRGPAPDPDGAAVALVRRLSEEDFGPGAARVADDGTISAPVH